MASPFLASSFPLSLFLLALWDLRFFSDAVYLRRSPDHAAGRRRFRDVSDYFFLEAAAVHGGRQRGRAALARSKAQICGGMGNPENEPYAGFSKDVPDSKDARGDAKPTCEGYGNCKECECDPQCAWCIDGGLCNKYCMGLDGEMSDGSNAVIVGTYMCRQIEDTENNHQDVDEDNYYHHGGIADWKKKEKYPIERPIDNAPSETALKKRAYSPFVYVEREKPVDDKNKLWGNKPYWRHMWNKGAEMGLPKEAGILKGMDPAYPVPAPYGFKSISSRSWHRKVAARRAAGEFTPK